MRKRSPTIASMRRKIAVGIRQLDAGKATPFDRKTLKGIKTRGRASLAARGMKRQRS